MKDTSANQILKSLKILICTHAYPPDAGGIAAFTRDIHQLLKNAGTDVTIFKPETGNGARNRLNSYLDAGRMCSQLLKAIRKSRPDVVICSRMLPLGPLVLLWSAIFNYRVIFQVHGTELRHRYKQGWRKKILRKMYNRADQIWANSQFTAGLLQDYGCDAAKIEVIYPFITQDAQEMAGRIDGRSAGKRFTLMTAAALYPRKGIDLVLKSLARLKDFDWEYRIAGKPYTAQYEGVYEKLAGELDIDQKVKFLGQLDRSELWREMAEADLFLMPSRGFEDDIESFGIVFIEAQQFGVPCIGTDVGGIKEAIGEGGIIIEDENIDELTQSIKYLIKHTEERNSLSDKSLKRIQKQFVEQSRRNDIQKALAGLSW